MRESAYRLALVLIGAGFAVAFCVLVLPPLLASGDVVGAFAAGFVNPYASGFALDAISCYLVLAVWVLHERRSRGIRHGWIALVLGVVPGVATAFAFYLLLRSRALHTATALRPV